MIHPITPSEAKLDKARKIPEGVIRAFNELISENFDGRESKFTQEAVVDRIMEVTDIAERDEIFENSYLDVEPRYEVAGWIVEYEKASWGGSDGWFTFTKR